MFKFDKEQEVFDFAGVKMGGQPGEYPTVLAGTIFYGGHNILNDELTGDFDKERAEQLVNDMASISDVTGNPYIVQVFALSLRYGVSSLFVIMAHEPVVCFIIEASRILKPSKVVQVNGTRYNIWSFGTSIAACKISHFPL